MRKLLFVLAFLFVPFAAQAQDALVVQTCGTVPATQYVLGSTAKVTVDVNGKLCSTSGDVTAVGTFTAGDIIVGAGLTSVQDSSALGSCCALAPVPIEFTGGTFPTFSANGQGAAGETTTQGLLLGGQGSTYDVVIVNSAGTAAAELSTGTVNWLFTGNIGVAGNLNFTGTGTNPVNGWYFDGTNLSMYVASGFRASYSGTTGLLYNNNTNANAVAAIQNANSGNAATTQMQFKGYDGAGTSALAYISVQGAGFSTGHGAKSMNFTAAGPIWFTGGATDALEIDASGNPYLPSLANATTAKTGSVCWNTGGGALTYDNTNTCLISSIRFKKNVQPIHDALSEVLAIKPVSFEYKDQSSPGIHIGFIAEQVNGVDPRFVVYGDDGLPLKLRLQEMPALAFGAIQQLNAKVERLQIQIDKLVAR